MSDLFAPLREPSDVTAPPAEHVRGRGDHLRRRRHVGRAAGAALVAGAVVFAAGLGGEDVDRSEAPPASASPSPVTTSPTPGPTDTATDPTGLTDAIDLAQGWSASGSEEQLRTGPSVEWLSSVAVCTRTPSPGPRGVAHLASVYAMPELTQARDLRVFSDAATARRVGEEWVGAFAGCPTFSVDGGASQTHNAVRPLDLGDQAWLVSQTYTSGGQPQLGEDILVVVRVGRSLLVTQWYGEGPGAVDLARSRHNARAQVAEARPLVARMTCVYTGASGC